MAFEVAVVEEVGEEELFKEWDGAGIEAEAAIELREKAGRQDHISGAEGRRDGTGEGIEVDHAAVGGEGEEGILGLAGDGQLGVEVVLDDIAVAARGDISPAAPSRNRTSCPRSSSPSC